MKPLHSPALFHQKKSKKKPQFFLAAFKKSVFLQPIWMSNGVMAAQLTLDQLV